MASIDHTTHVRVQRSYRTVKHRRRIPVVTAKIVRSPSPRHRRRERTSINKAVWFRRVSIHTRASKEPPFCSVCQQYRLATVRTCGVDMAVRPGETLRVEDRTQRRCRRKKHTHFIRKSYTMNPQSTDTRVVSRDSCDDRSSEAACTHQLLGRHACTQCHDVMTVTTYVA